ncbi:hypothetical protein PPERSA_11110 [Pseudocohnilembus persalinus]|uniref:Dynein heavy chain coiled coil stalk domain-containing protein n=1 Tax=Pseudocohnilembus persalinus TaxID=266149 RepID=A0A0V0QYZ6_PSEPJ|nr:hypothetical protein PPERSA_11110 [Pseudocohnilembus persalinus]|eukprot:KRX07561.1 hypothetical protein PPERSA_11110 [Pseudocohnilembus persalinus]
MKYELTQMNSQQYIYNFQEVDEYDDEIQRQMQEIDQKEVEHEQNIKNFKNELDERKRFLAIQKLEFQNQEEDQKRKIEIEKKRKEEMIQFMRIQQEKELIEKIKQKQKEEHERLEIERLKKLEEKKEKQRKIQLENQRKKRKLERQELRDQKRRENQQKIQEMRDERENLYRQKNKCEQQILNASEKIKQMIQLNQDNQSQKALLQQKIEQILKIKQIIQEKQQEFSGQNQQLQEFMDSIQKQLDGAQKAVYTLSNEDLIFIQNLKHPPERIKLCLEAVIVALTGTTKQKQLVWDKIQKEVGNINFRRNILNYDAGKMNQAIVQKLKNSYINDQNWDLDKMRKAAKAAGVLSLWIDSIVKYQTMMVENQPLFEQMKKFKKNQQEIQEQEEMMKEQILQGKSIDQIQQEIQNLDIQQDLIQKQEIQLNIEESQFKEEFDRLNEKIKELKTDQQLMHLDILENTKPVVGNDHPWTPQHSLSKNVNKFTKTNVIKIGIKKQPIRNKQVGS